MTNNQGQELRVPKFITYVIAIALIADILLSLYHLKNPRDIDTKVMLYMYLVILGVAGNIFILAAIFKSSISMNDKIKKQIKNICFVLIAITLIFFLYNAFYRGGFYYMHPINFASYFLILFYYW